jgi:cytochrome c553
MNWKMDVTKQTKIPETVIKNDTLVETCARCHARATRFSDQYIHGRSLLQTHIPATIDAEHYYMDGQIREEDYEYGSFLQSKMYAAGVTCINCHEPHSMKVN